jgi:hypothetical protein
LNLPESQRLAAQTLDKLALFLAHVAITNTGGLVTNTQSYVARSPTASFWRPLLDDLLREETYLEVARAPGGRLNFIIAFRLDEQRAALWETNVAAALALTPEIRALAADEGAQGWQLSNSNRVALASLGNWTTLSLSSPSGPSPVADFRARIQRDQAPFRPSTNGAWVEGEVDSGAVAEAMGLDFKPPSGCPKVSFMMAWDSGTVRTYGLLNFPKPLAGGAQPWEIPSNYIQGAISSFSAIRGIKPWLASLKAWNALEAGPPPDQLFAWGLQGLPMNTFFAAPQPDASNQVGRIADFVMQKGSYWFATNDSCKFEKSASGCGLDWKGPPYLTPFLRPGVDRDRNFILAGLFPFGGTNEPLPAELLRVLAPTNLVAYSWEMTDMRVQQLLFISQFIRLVAGREQLPPQSATLLWLKAILPRLSKCVSVASQTAPNQIAITRRSNIGFSALELHLLSDWLDSPQFPFGSFSLLTPAVTYELPMPKPPGAPVSGGGQGVKPPGGRRSGAK